METNRWTAGVVAAAVVISGTATTAASAHRRLAHPPIHVSTPTGGSLITPYFFPYGSHYRYNSPGPVYGQLEYWGSNNGCRLWRYNYLYWVC
jgi:hypothetical protein